ncbi:MAG: flagellar hook-length control protein FliK [Clostridiales bacterium]|nr:flagellar hook-length control protein FliK [Clostridiales bacterium]
MDQMNSLAMSMLQTMTSATELPKTGKSGETDEFQKLLEEKTQAKDPLVEQPAKPQAPAKKTEKAPVQKQENALERAKKLAEQGAWFTQPNIANVQIDLDTGETIAVYQPGEYVLAHLDGQTELIPITDLEPWEQLQLRQLVTDLGQTVDVSDPEADAILEATAPGADNSPAAMLEKLADEEVGQVARQVVEEVQPQEGEDDAKTEVEVTEVEQAPQRIFHDVKAAPVKVGEAEDVQQAEQPDVANQIDTQLAQALQKGESMVRIQLNPENLGSVTVEISRSAEGVLHIALNAHSGETRSLLERHAADLQGLVSSRTQQEVQVDVQRQQESQQNQNQQQNYDGHNGHAQNGQERRQRREHTNSQDFMQQLRLGLIPADGDI